ncbi:MAG: hypothetical protein E6371_12885 [Terrisporobacter othiniensis]|uniref:hypothetical protein n=1 Tax=Terrisporobacter othiniensis TaxID=1577792 RepID=UPI0029087DC4|nr:hypothetical protein [Terrisporobacter othiniensis]MDU6985303.1 hypothetical protein [Terrisporobacter othiniensis]
MANYSMGIKTMKKNGENKTSIMDIKCEDVDIYVFPGSLSPNDIVLKYKSHDSRRRTPKHIHFVIDLLIKKEHESKLVKSFIDTLLLRFKEIKGLEDRTYNSIYNNLIICRNKKILNKYDELNKYGEYSVEFLLNFGELLMLQEKTNMKDAYMFKNVMEKIRDDKDIYSIVSSATHNGK